MGDKNRSGLSEPSLSRLSDEERQRPGESFLSRFHRRKTQARTQARQSTDPSIEEADASAVEAGADTDVEPRVELTDADMPPLETLDFDSDYTGFLSPKVSESLRRAALRKLFRGVEFNVVDGLDEYADDFTTFEPLGDLVTTDMRHRLEAEARRQAEILKQALLDEGDDVEHDDSLDVDRTAMDRPKPATATPGPMAGRADRSGGGETENPAPPPTHES
jgi:hypothetical protein